ncbi:hypothetical protein HLH34_04340 [Gluconacetobacter azotocaptans]|uniref:Uncharacterized protein n=2 Tax=Gluconacetobacter azotocaptans TaxID=142834 RepID=A0A7W4PCZ3_9PROT|nr:hypothetical protein [Gluconacetobacter azotocaptans]
MPSGQKTDWSRIDPQLPNLLRSGRTDPEIAAQFGMPRSSIADRINLLELGSLRQRRLGGRTPAVKKSEQRPTPRVPPGREMPDAARASAPRITNADRLRDQVRVTSSGATYVRGGRMLALVSRNGGGKNG